MSITTDATQKKTFSSLIEDRIKSLYQKSSDQCTSCIKFLAVNPPLIPEKPFDREVAKKQGYYNFPPTGPMYLCASIDSLALEEVTCDVIDLNNYLLKLANTEGDYFEYSGWKSAFDKYKDPNCAYVFMLSYMFGTTKECFTNTSAFIRQRFPNSLIITGGVQATFDKIEILESGFADVLGTNEGDLQIQYLASLIHSSLSNLTNNWKSPEPHLDPQGGLYIRAEDGSIYDSGTHSQPSSFDWNLDRYYEMIDIKSYHKYGGLGAFSKFVESMSGYPVPYSAVLTKRGCRAHCAFCTVRNFNGKGLRLRNIEAVINEIEYLYSQGIRHIDWLDDDLLFDEAYNLELFSRIKQSFPDLVWTASNGLIGVAITEKLMRAMAESGLKAFKIGVESGNSEVIKEIRKPTTLWRLLDKSHLIRQYPDIFFSANFIIGFPGETFGQMMDSFIFANKLACDWSSFYVCQPLKGTDLYSSFQHLMDPRAKEESYTKTINPGRSAARGEFAYTEGEDLSGKVLAGWQIFDMALDRTFDAEAHNEIWFTFNLVANFFANPCYQSKELTHKLIHWLTAIHSGYPFDASMTAALSYSYRIIGNTHMSDQFAQRTENLLLESTYWQNRLISFPQILTLCGLSKSSKICQLLDVEPPKELIPGKYAALFLELTEKRNSNNWRD